MRVLASLVLLAALATPLAARAQDPLPLDIELVRPGLSTWGGFAVDAPQSVVGKTWSAGALLQYENAPLRVYDGDEVLGDLVEHRTVAQLHGGISASRRTSFSLVVPVGGHFGADEDVPRARNGAGLGDVSLTARVLVGAWKPFSLGVVGTVLLPVGNKAQYMGERLPRLRIGLLGHTDFGRVRLLTNLMAFVRQPLATKYDLTATSELHLDVGVQGAVLPGQLDVIGELVSRIGLSRDGGGGRLASELIAGVRYTPGSDPTRGVRIDVALGKGLTPGFGATTARAMLGITYVGGPRPKPEVVEVPPPVPLPDALVEAELPEAEPPPPPPPPPAARLEGDQIVFRDTIEFEVGTTRLLPVSEPVLDAVAGVILQRAAGLHVVVEGHASDEGGYAYNYALSNDRARAIVEALVLRGVHPKRLSWRAAGEVEPLGSGEDEATRERNRRVVFRVMRPIDDTPRVYDPDVLLPWSGEAHRAVEPEVPATPPPEATAPTEPAAPPVEVAPPAPAEEPSFEAPRDELDVSTEPDEAEDAR